LDALWLGSAGIDMVRIFRDPKGEAMTEHWLKIWPEYFQAKKAGVKDWEIRSTEDRFFEVGDHVKFREFDPVTSQFTRREMNRIITYIHVLDDMRVIFSDRDLDNKSA
jgi:protein tyrosine/serine phosphatase